MSFGRLRGLGSALRHAAPCEETKGCWDMAYDKT